MSRLDRRIFEGVDRNESLQPTDQSSYFLRNGDQQTPLSVAVRVGAEKSINSLLEHGAVASVFVQSYSAQGLVCTLPMALQPESSCFVHPPPLTGVPSHIVTLIDEKLADYVDDLKQKHRMEESSETLKNGNSSTAGPTVAVAPPALSPFNHYPPILQVGDVVRRGPSWHWGGQDEKGSGGVRCAGVVTAAGGSLTVEWRTDPADPSSVFHTNGYTYDPANPGGPELFLVDQKNPTSTPKGIPPPTLAASAPPVQPADRFKQGDKVRLVSKCSGSALVSSKESLRAASKNCLGEDINGRVGVIVNVKKDLFSGKRTSGARRRATGEEDNVVTVMSVHSGGLCEYASSDLRYADGSMPGNDDKIVKPPIISTSIKQELRNPSTQSFNVGDKVRLRRDATDLRGCLGDPKDMWVGDVDRAGSGSSKVGVKSYAASGGNYPHLSGNFPHHSYPPSMLILEHESEDETQTPLWVGDRVTLADTFDENNKEGWCLGSVASPKEGVVVFSPSTSGSELRDVGVASLDDLSQVFWFRSSWLKRVPNKGNVSFAVGDRVQLDVTMWSPETVETGGKCLGSPIDATYGVVCGVGKERDGIVRNIEVVAAIGSARGEVSLYPSYSLVKATRLFVLDEDRERSLIESIEKSIALLGIAEEGISVSKLVRQYGLNIWGRLINISRKPQEVLDLWTQWMELQSSSWPLSESEIMGTLSFDNGSNKPSDPYSVTGFASVYPGKVPTTWICSKESGGKCKGYVNSVKDLKCKICDITGKKWKCGYCSGSNKIFAVSCSVCSVLRSDSDAFVEERMRRRFEDAESARKEEEDEDRIRLDMIKKEQEDLQVAFDLAEKSEGQFKHPGSFLKCGGNPEGFMRCVGDGKCSSGASSCNKCGAGTHWSCCSSMDPLSTVCISGFTEEQSVKNALLFSAKSAKLTRIKDVPGFFSPYIDKDNWSCAACTFFNPMANTKCGVCEAVRPSDAPLPDPIDAPAISGVDEILLSASDIKCSSSVASHPSSNLLSDDMSTYWESNSPCCPNEVAVSIPKSKKSKHSYFNFEIYTKDHDSYSPETVDIFAESMLIKSMSLPTSEDWVTLLTADEIKTRFPKKPPSSVKICVKKNHSGGSHTRISRIRLIRQKVVILERHDYNQNGQCRICVKCAFCTGYGSGCALCRGIDRSGEKGKSCGCGTGLAGCSKCGQCESCGGDSDTCTGAVQKAVAISKKKTEDGDEDGENQTVSIPLSKFAESVDRELVRSRDEKKLVGGTGRRLNNDSDDDNDDSNSEDEAVSSHGSVLDDQDSDCSSDESDDNDSTLKTSDSHTDQNITGAPSIYLSELKRNLTLSEKYFLFPRTISPDKLISSCDNVDLNAENDSDLDRLPPPAPISRHTSVGFNQMGYFEPLTDIVALCNYADKNGNTAAHHAAYIGLHKTADALFKSGASRWRLNSFGDSAASLKDGYFLKSGESVSRLHKVLSQRKFLESDLVRLAINTPADYTTPHDLQDLVDSILLGSDNEANAEYFAQLAVKGEVPHAKLYRALFYVQFDFGSVQAKRDLADYEADLKQGRFSCLDPVYYYVRFRLFKTFSGHVSSYAKKDRLAAFDALTALRMYSNISRIWIDPRESFEKDVIDAGLDSEEFTADIEEDDYSDLFPPLGPEDPETQWEVAKEKFKLVSPSMDELMRLTGLKNVKHKAKDICLQVLLKPPADLQGGTSTNFTFIGNPGTGKTTVATLISKAMVELHYRENPVPILTSADDILGDKQPAAAFAQMVNDSLKGTMFIDEAYLFDPAPKGKTQNDSNKVLNALMKASEEHKLTTTFILAGLKEEMQTLMGWNPGLPSRFPKPFSFEFVDYNEAELTKIMSDMARNRKFRFSSQKECGVPIARVLARRIHKSANKKGFDNARACEKILEVCIQNQQGRLRRLMEKDIPISDNDYRTLTRADTVGERPKLEDSPHMAELNEMIGLASVKEKMKNLMNLQLQNYDAEMRGERIQLISLHRVFYGNPGTGKTTVAKLYGKMLKQFGFLSDGDIIIVTPADLKGSAVGEAAARTKALLDSAKGKVLFIDEAYNLDPARMTGTFGAEVLDVILEKIEANAGSDMAVIMAGYQPQMEQLFRNVKNPGLKRRFNLGEAFYFDDFCDADIRKVLKRIIVQAELFAEGSVLDYAVSLISQKRMEEGFGNAGEAEQILNRAKLRLSARLSSGTIIANMKELIKEDFEGEITSVEKARAAFDGLENIDHVMTVIQMYEAMCDVADQEGRPRHELLSDCHMLFLGPPGTGKTTMGKRFAKMFKQLNLLPSDRFEYTTAGNLIDRFVGGTGNNTVEAMRRAKGGVLMIDEAYAMLPKRNGFGADIMQALLDNITTEEFKGKIVIILGGYKEQVEEIFGFNPGFQSRFDKKRIEFPEWDENIATAAIKHAIERDGKEIEIDAHQAMIGYFRALKELPNWASGRDTLDWIKPALDAARAERQFKRNQELRMLEPSAGPKSKSVNSAAARAKLPPPLPYSLEDVKKVFTDAIGARGGVLDVFGGEVAATGPGKTTKKINSLMKFKDERARAKRLDKLLVACFTNPSSCQPCVRYEPEFEEISRANPEAIFIVIDADNAPDVFENIGVQGVPTTIVYFKDVEIGRVSGCNPVKLREIIAVHFSKQKKMAANLPDLAVQNRGDGPARAAPAKVAEKYEYIEKTPDNDPQENGSDDDDCDEDIGKLLEEACGELGYDLKKLRDMLADSKTFPPKELLDKIYPKVKNRKNIRKIPGALQRERPSVLARVNSAIEEDDKQKSEEEKRTIARVQAIGKCPMGYTWHKEGGGWRCGGGSHFVTDEQLQQHYMNNV